jgi:dihydroorotase
VIVEAVRVEGRGPLVDLVVEHGVVAAIRPSAAPDRGRTALPGLVDLHTHLREPGGNGSETVASGTRAAAAGGYTDVFAMANTAPVTDDPDRYGDYLELARDTPARVHPVSAATLGRAGEAVVDVAAMAATGAVLFSDDGTCVWRDEVVTDLMTRVAAVDGVFAQHAQDPRVVGPGVVNARVAERLGAAPWPPEGEERIVARDLEVVRRTGARLHVCHVSTAGTAALVRAAKEEGLPVTAEVTPHHLVLTDDDAAERGPALKVNPPLRSAADARALRAALRDGTIDVVGTDHAPHPAADKDLPWESAAFGLTAIETAVAVVAEALTGADGVDWARLAAVMATEPARIGRVRHTGIAVGAPATFCVVESGGAWPVVGAAQYSLSANTPFEGRVLAHRVVLTLCEGRVTHALS